jgi:hypothetical protein
MSNLSDFAVYSFIKWMQDKIRRAKQRLYRAQKSNKPKKIELETVYYNKLIIELKVFARNHEETIKDYNAKIGEAEREIIELQSNVLTKIENEMLNEYSEV